MGPQILNAYTSDRAMQLLVVYHIEITAHGKDRSTRVLTLT